MNDSTRRAVGIGALFLLIATLVTLGAWRLAAASRMGWAGLTYLPTPTKKGAPARSMPLGMNPGSVMMVYPGAPADRAGVRRGDEIVALNGIPATDLKRLTALSASIRSGESITYTIKRKGVTRSIPLRLEPPTRSTAILSVLIMNTLVGLTFVSIGAFVFWRRPSDTRIIVFYIMTLTAAASFVGGALSQVDTSNIRGIAIEPTLIDLSRALTIVATTLFFAPLLLHLSLIFPVERPVLTRRRSTLFKWIYGLPVYLCICIAIFLVSFGVLTSARGNEKTVAKGIGIVLLIILGGATIASIVRLTMRMRRKGFREAVLSSPLEILTLVLAVVAGLSVLAIWMTAKLHAPGVMFGFSIVTLFFFFGLLAAYPVATVMSLLRSYRESGIEERRQVKWPLWATIVAVASRLILLAVSIGFGLALTFSDRFSVSSLALAAPDLVAKALYTLIPLSFAFAILKYRLMNIDVIIRRTVLYSLLTGAIFVLYAVLVAGLGTALIKFGGVRNQSVLIASTVVIALVTVPLRTRLQQLVDRNLFRERRDYAFALRNLSNAIASSTAVDAFLRAAAGEIQQALQNRFVLIALRRGDEYVATSKIGVADEIIGRLRIPTNAIEFNDKTAPEALRKLGTSLVVPIAAHRQPTGFLALGSRLSDEEFSPGDVEFIIATAAQIAVGIENVRLRDEEADFEQARSMQQILLPKSIPQLEGFEISGLWQPAKSVGGDYFDVLPLGEGRVGLCIADVAGKGMPAALLMANLQAAVKGSATRDERPSAVCERVKHIVTGNLAGGKFISFFYGVLDAPARTLTYCNAGHNPPIVVRSDGRIDRLTTGGPVICRFFQSAVHQQDSIDVQAGDRVVLFTDGVSEARRGEEEFGEDQLIEFVTANRGTGARDMEAKLLMRLREYTAGDFSDDVTMVIVSATQPTMNAEG